MWEIFGRNLVQDKALLNFTPKVFDLEMRSNIKLMDGESTLSFILPAFDLKIGSNFKCPTIWFPVYSQDQKSKYT